MGLSENLRHARVSKGLTQQQVADALQITKSTYSGYELGRREPDAIKIKKLAKLFDVSGDTLLGIKIDEGSQITYPFIANNLLPVPEMRKVPLVGTIACGLPVLATENIEEHIDMPAHIHADFALRCKGDSMLGSRVRIHDGDIVYIRKQDDVDSGIIAAVLIGDEATLKRVYKQKDKLILQPENPEYPPMIYAGQELDKIRIIGRAVAYTAEI